MLSEEHLQNAKQQAQQELIKLFSKSSQFTNAIFATSHHPQKTSPTRQVGQRQFSTIRNKSKNAVYRRIKDQTRQGRSSNPSIFDGLLEGNFEEAERNLASVKWVVMRRRAGLKVAHDGFVETISGRCREWHDGGVVHLDREHRKGQ